MKRAVIFILAIFALGSMSAQQSVEKTVLKPINLKGYNHLEANLDGKVNVKTWTNEYAQVEINIKAYGLNAQILKALVAAGRYNIHIDYKDDKVVLTTPDLSKSIKVRGTELKDEVTFTIFMPEYCKLDTKEKTTSVGSVSPSSY